jgi:hypothetical protein
MLSLVWLFLLSAITRLVIALIKDVENIQQGIVMTGFVLFISLLMFASGKLLYNLILEK